jgi:hypothetical protein
LIKIAADPPQAKLFDEKIKQVLFIEADICADAFTGPNGFFSRLGPFQKKLVLYVSSQDAALLMSDYANRDDCHGVRLGQGGPALNSLKNVVTIDASQVGGDWGLGHMVFFRDAVINDMYLSLNQGLEPSQRLLSARSEKPDQNRVYDIFDGVHIANNISTFSGLAAFGISSQLGFDNNSYSTGLRVSAFISLLGYQRFQVSLGYFNNIIPSQYDLRLNLGNYNFRPYLNAGIDYNQVGTGASDTAVLGGHLGFGLEYDLDSGWALAFGTNYYSSWKVWGSLAAQPTLNSMYNDADYPIGQLYFQFSKYFDLPI